MRQFGMNVALLLSFFLLAFLYTKIAGPIPFFINSVTTQKLDTFNVTGEGKVEVKPDIALITIGISANAATVKEVQNKVNQIINQVSQSVKQLGVKDEDIKTSNYNISPEYDYTQTTRRITGYSASSNLIIKVKDIDKINQVIDTATQKGANNIGGISFDVDAKTKALDQAREEAVKDAKTKAQAAAKIAGFRLGRIINYSENQQDIARPFIGGGVALMAKEVAEPTRVEPGSNTITVNIVLSYEID